MTNTTLILGKHEFKLLDEIGSGTYSKVYKAIDRNHQREVAIKCMLLDSERHGYGVLTIRSENSMKKLRRYYVGEWKNDRMDRFGTLYITETDYYEGQFVNGKRCGWGRMFYSNGDM